MHIGVEEGRGASRLDTGRSHEWILEGVIRGKRIYSATLVEKT
jgi:hypothetical protein